MKLNRTFVALIFALLVTFGTIVIAQVNRPYRNGTVWAVSYIRVKPGMDSAYLNYIAGDWKRQQEAQKKDGLILSYKVLQTEAHGSDDWNMMLMTEYKDLATYETNLAKADALLQTVIGNDEAQRQGYRQRLEIREVVETRLAREIVLQPNAETSQR